MEHRIVYKDILIGCYFAKNISNKNIIFCQGLPQYVTPKHSFIKDYLDIGYNVFVPRYYGSWESGGVFSPTTVVETIKKTIQFVKLGYGIDTYSNSRLDWDGSGSLTMIGFSFGALPAISLCGMVTRTILIAPFIMDPSNKSSVKEVTKTLIFMNNGYRNAYRIIESNSKFVEEYSSLIKKIQLDNKSRLTIVRGLIDDASVSSDILKGIKDTRLYNIGHTAELDRKYYNGIL